jgi:hypothetical protein
LRTAGYVTSRGGALTVAAFLAGLALAACSSTPPQAGHGAPSSTAPASSGITTLPVSSTTATTTSPPTTSVPPTSTTVPPPELYVFTGVELGELFAWPDFPKGIQIDNHDYLSGLVWTADATGAAATGSFAYDECEPDCAAGRYASVRVVLTASQPESCLVSLYDPTTGVGRLEQVYAYGSISVQVTGGGKPPLVPAFPSTCSPTYSGRVNGWDEPVPLRRVTNVSVEGLKDAELVGTLVFTTHDPHFAALYGKQVSVWRAPAEFPGLLVVHNGAEGPQPIYGTWVYTPAYELFWQGARRTLDRVQNVSVESLSDAVFEGEGTGFATDDPYYAALDGGPVNVWRAPAEFPGALVAHNGAQGSQPVYGTWTVG